MEYETEEEIDLATLDIDPVTGEILNLDKPSLFSEPRGDEIRFSASLIEDYAKCPARAYARITRQPSEKGVALILGIAIHEAFEQLLKFRKAPKETYSRAFEREAELNKISLTTEDAMKKRLEGEKMIAAGYTILSHEGQDGKPFYEKVDPSLVERYFRLKRNNRVYVGKVDLIHFEHPGVYSIVDYKTNKNVPAQSELDSKLQFSIYDWAAFNDPESPTHGKWPQRNVWLHLRGKNIAKDPSGKAVRKESEKKYQYSFPTTRTPEEVERAFTETIEPIAEQIENGVFFKVEADHCAWCPYVNRATGRCGVTLPERKKIHAGSMP